jgi:hypothetical protein
MTHIANLHVLIDVTQSCGFFFIATYIYVHHRFMLLNIVANLSVMFAEMDGPLITD